ncbi:MAG: GGDEF domain-containing protein [Deltaproteobacteria bacterium]|nr:GGDEF domain-containing protein [Deltaproteobacteria bacterium]
MNEKDKRIEKIRKGERRTHDRQSERRGAIIPLSTPHPSLLKMVLSTIVSIFIAETIVMILFSFLPPFSNKVEVLLGSLILIFLILLPIYVFVMRPMKSLLATKNNFRSLSLTDELTGLYNRRGLFTFADHEIKTASRGVAELCVLYADVDNFKKINDKLGHKEGDNALVNIASILKKCFRDYDILARLGGDEFVIIPVGTEVASVGLLTERLERRIEEHNNIALDPYKLSLSTGTACSLSANTSSIDELLAIADRSMYEHKISKNICHWSDN